MSKMKELYEKVAGDNALQAKFAEIMKEAEKSDDAKTSEKLIAFAKEAGYEVSLEEVQEFFKALAEKNGKLSDSELDMVAGGKMEPNRPNTIGGLPDRNCFAVSVQGVLPGGCAVL